MANRVRSRFLFAKWPRLAVLTTVVLSVCGGNFIAEVNAENTGASPPNVSALPGDEVVNAVGIAPAGNSLGSRGQAKSSDSKVDEAFARARLGFDRAVGSIQSGSRDAVEGAKDYARLKKIVVDGNKYLSRDQVVRATGLKGKPWLWEVSPEDVRNNLKDHPWIEDALVSKDLVEASVKVEIFEAEPWIVAKLSGESWLIASSGRPLQLLESLRQPTVIVQSAELPRLDGLDQNVEGKAVASNTRFTKAIRELTNFRLSGAAPFVVERYTYLPDGGLMLTPLQPELYPVVLIRADDIETSKRSLQQLGVVISDIKTRGEQSLVKQIDLRFDSQAVVRLLPPVDQKSEKGVKRIAP